MYTSKGGESEAMLVYVGHNNTVQITYHLRDVASRRLVSSFAEKNAFYYKDIEMFENIRQGIIHDNKKSRLKVSMNE